MSLIPPAPPRFGSPGQIAPDGDKDWLQMFRFFNLLCRYLINIASAFQSVIAGATSGVATFTQIFQGVSYSKVVIYCDALTGAATYTFPSPFTHQPAIMATDQLAPALITSLSTTAVTVTGAGTTGFLFLEGF